MPTLCALVRTPRTFEVRMDALLFWFSYFLKQKKMILINLFVLQTDITYSHTNDNPIEWISWGTSTKRKALWQLPHHRHDQHRPHHLRHRQHQCNSINSNGVWKQHCQLFPPSQNCTNVKNHLPKICANNCCIVSNCLPSNWSMRIWMAKVEIFMSNASTFWAIWLCRIFKVCAKRCFQAMAVVRRQRQRRHR